MGPMFNWFNCLFNWPHRLIGPNSSAYFEAELSGTHCINAVLRLQAVGNIIFNASGLVIASLDLYGTETT